MLIRPSTFRLKPSLHYQNIILSCRFTLYNNTYDNFIPSRLTIGTWYANIFIFHFPFFFGHLYFCGLLKIYCM